MEIVHLDGVLFDVVGEIIGAAVAGAGIDAAASHPDGETARVMVAAVVVSLEIALAVGGAAKFTSPEDERFVEESTHFEVADERCGWLIGVSALFADLFGEITVLIPAHVEELDEANPAFGEAAGLQAVGGVGAGLGHVRAIHF